jgi:hypothetical protein
MESINNEWSACRLIEFGRQAISYWYVFISSQVSFTLDISLWLCRISRDGSRSPHIQMLLDRISKLLFYKIHPIFVFDGKNVPGLKKQVLVG